MLYKLLITVLMICDSIYFSYGTSIHGYPGSIGKNISSFITNIFLNSGPETIANNNNSIQYHLYTPEHPEEICYFEPNISNNCSIDATDKTKVLIHGYNSELLPGNLFEQIKDALLDYDRYNVIIVNWTQYSGSLYTSAVENTYFVGLRVRKTLKFLVSHRGVNPLDIHIIGHSLGAHVAGVAGKRISNLGRITGLEPAGQLFTKAIRFNRLTYTSANFVDVMHTSNYLSGEGFGLGDAIGSIDFYPNGGIRQPACKIGGTYLNSEALVIPIRTVLDLATCNHDIVLLYFLDSINICYYLSVECPNYLLYAKGRCNTDSNPTDRMGFHSAPIQDLPDESTFYVKTSATMPYC